MTVADDLASLRRLVWETCGPEPVGEDYHEECREIRAALDRVVAEIARLERERDEQTDVTEDVAKACFDWKQRAEAAEAELARLRDGVSEARAHVLKARRLLDALLAEDGTADADSTGDLDADLQAQGFDPFGSDGAA